MKLLVIVLLVSVAGAFVCWAKPPAGSTSGKDEDAGPKVGEPAPAFSLPASDGKRYSLSRFKGKKAVVVAWFPKAFTGG